MKFSSISAVFKSSRPALTFNFYESSAGLSSFWALKGDERDFSTFRLILNSLVDQSIDPAFDHLVFCFKKTDGEVVSLRRSKDKDSISEGSEKWSDKVDRAIILSEIFKLPTTRTNYLCQSELIRHFEYRPTRNTRAVTLGPEGQPRIIIHRWIENHIRDAELKIQSLLDLSSIPERSNLNELYNTIRPVNDLYKDLHSHYGYLFKSPGNLRFLSEKREKLQAKILSFQQVENALDIIATQSKFLLQKDEEEKIRKRLQSNLNECGLKEAPSVEELPVWSELIKCLGETKYSEQIISLTDKLNRSFLQKTKQPIDQYSNDLKELSDTRSKIIKEINKMIEIFDEYYESQDPLLKKLGKTVVRKSYESKARKEILNTLINFKNNTKNLSVNFPSAEVFEAPSKKLEELKNSQIIKLTSLKEEWKSLTKLPLNVGLNDFFRYGMLYFELIWYAQIISENDRVRNQIRKKLKALAESMSKICDKEIKDTPEEIKEALKTKSSELSKTRKKLNTIEDSLIKLGTRWRINAEVTNRSNELIGEWQKAFKTFKFNAVEIASPMAEELFGYCEALQSLQKLKGEQSIELFSPKLKNIGLSTWSLYPIRRTDFIAMEEHIPKSKLPYNTIAFVSNQEAYERILSFGIGRVEMNTSEKKVIEEKEPKKFQTPIKALTEGERVANLLNGIRE